MAGSLPTEIWIQICETLCVCCQMPKHADGIPDFRLTSAREGKAALLSMCLVSRYFKDMSQRILFHYFLNCPKGGDLGFQGTNDDRVPSFLRALISKPSLGNHVRMVGLFQPPFQRFHDIKRNDLQVWSRVSAGLDIPVPGEVLRALAGMVAHNEPSLVFVKPGPNAKLVQSHHRTDERFGWFDMVIERFYEWLHLLTLNLVPQVTHLQLTRPLRSLRGLQMPPRTFPQLREVTYDMYTRMEDIISSNACFPNLETLDARDLDIFARDFSIIASAPMMQIRKLSICCTPKELLSILPICPLLEDLACQCSPRDWDNEVAAIEWPAHTRNTLRRLAWGNEDASQIFRHHAPQRLCTPPLLRFERLEVLEIDQSSLLVYTQLLEAETLSAVLPKTLRILHIAFAREVLSQLQIARQLRKLAYARAMDLPELSIVRVDDPPRRRAKTKALAQFMEATGVLSVMDEAGIALQIGQEAPWSDFDRRSILSQPPGAGNKESDVIFQHEVFSLDDPQTAQDPACSGVEAVAD